MAPADSPLRIEVVYSPRAGDVQSVSLALPAGTCVRNALEASGLANRFPELAAFDALSVGVWGRLQALDAPLRDRDRVEVYRALQVDPKEARRRRQARQQPKAAANRQKPRA